MKKVEIAIQGAYNRCVTPEEVVQIESLIVRDIERRLREGRTNCIECDIGALTYHNTIRLVFDDLIHKRAEKDKDWKGVAEVLLNGKI